MCKLEKKNMQAVFYFPHLISQTLVNYKCIKFVCTNDYVK